MKCIISEDISKEVYAKILKFTKDIILIRKFKPLYEAVQSHPDIQLFSFEDNYIVVHPQIHRETIDALRKYHINYVFGEKILSREYPHNIAYNAAEVGNKIFHNFSYTDTVLQDEIERRKCKLVQIKQGYSKCSVLVLNDTSMITSDPGIARKAIDNNVDVLLISAGSIDLPGLNYGFIGGASGVIKREGIVVFNGGIALHPDASRIIEFIAERGLTYICLSQKRLIDTGSIFFLP